MSYRTFLLATLSGAALGISLHFGISQSTPQNMTAAAPPAYIQPNTLQLESLIRQHMRFNPSGFAGAYLASHHAHAENDWDASYRYFTKVMAEDENNEDLRNRAMLLAMGAGNLEDAAQHAVSLDNQGLVPLILALQAVAQGDIQQAEYFVEDLSDNAIGAFMAPVFEGWLAREQTIDALQTQAAQTAFDRTRLYGNPVHAYNAVLMALADDNIEEAHTHIAFMLENLRLTRRDLMRVAMVLASTGEKDTALGLIKDIGQSPSGSMSQEIDRFLTRIETKSVDELRADIPAGTKTGIATGLYDMAQILLQEDSVHTAHLFAQMALALKPDLTDAQLLMSEIMIETGHEEDAIRYLSSIAPDHPHYLTFQRTIAELMHITGKHEAARNLLNQLFIDHNDINALIRIGDLYRDQDNFENALRAYNRAADAVGQTITEDYWHLLYARGMTYERKGLWPQAEKDLKAALTFRPDHPYLLNYLGYSWADQGQNLEESLELIRRAVELRPRDGYIIDSLGWALYKMGRYAEAVPHLEKAVALLPYEPVINDHLGDAYWKVGRKLEARFQWERAYHHADEDTDIEAIREKMARGLTPPDQPKTPVKEAWSEQATSDNQ